LLQKEQGEVYSSLMPRFRLRYSLSDYTILTPKIKKKSSFVFQRKSSGLEQHE